MVTIKDVADKCGVAYSTVSKALNGQPGVSKEKVEQIRKIAQEMGYFPNIAARSLKTSRSNIIAVVFEDKTQEIGRAHV